MKELQDYNYEQGIIDQIELMDKIRFESPLKTIELACDFKKIAEKNSDINLMGYADFYIADAYLTLGEFDNAINYFNKAAREFDAVDNIYKRGGCLNSLGILYATRGEIVYSLDNFKEAASLAEKSNDDFVAALAYENYAEISDNIKDSNISMEYAMKAYKHILKCNQNPRQKTIEIIILTTLAKLYYRFGLYDDTKKKIDQIEDIVRKHPDEKLCVDFYITKLIYTNKVSSSKEEKEICLKEAVKAYYDTEYKVDYFLYIFDFLHFLKRTDRKDILLPLVEDFDESVKGMDFPYIQTRILDFKISLYDEEKDKDKLYKELIRYRRYNNSYKMLTTNSIRKYISIQNSLEDSKRANELLKEQVGIDELTGLSNRWRLSSKVEALLTRAVTEKKNYAVEMLDIDHFKQINDENGHHVGDLCLIIVATALKAIESDDIYCFRYGGDEFLIFYLGYSDEKILEMANNLRDSILEMSELRDLPYVYISQGICSGIPEKKSKVWDYSSKADTAMYSAKRGLGKHIKLVNCTE
ncbi:GGDEF domain-containing protein [Lachnospira sp.]|jgi:diguanylate cyclase (GGDEF)-like protein|uniref:GGDEF domain-containing protein n=1 Tax=Lachnospira sp. TaxID=2049031 RepID=UPI00257A6091|nr:GGDEF domain-containing protein [Lachnospira sp.]